MRSLQGVGVLVTRPEQQALPLCRLLEAEGATTFRLPALDIKPMGERRDWNARLGTLYAFSLIIFTSANAVRFGVALLGRQRDLPLAAIGPATARALEREGYRVAVTPVAGFDSESLLRHPTLQQLQGRRVLIVKGGGGRELLREQLAARGAHVVTADVYRRERPSHTQAELEEITARFRGGHIHVITATSVESAGNLVELATPELRLEFDRVHWVVPSKRVAEGLRACGVSAPFVQAGSAEDHELVSAVVGWRAAASTAGWNGSV